MGVNCWNRRLLIFSTLSALNSLAILQTSLKSEISICALAYTIGAVLSLLFFHVKIEKNTFNWGWIWFKNDLRGLGVRDDGGGEGYQFCLATIFKFYRQKLDWNLTRSVFNLYNKTRHSYIYIYCVKRIAGQTAGPIVLKFCLGHSWEAGLES